MSAGNVVEQLELSGVGMGLRKVAQIVSHSDFTDNGDTTGDLTLENQLPVGAFVIGTKVKVLEAFSGGSNTTATMTVGKTAGEDEFTDGTSVNVAAVGVVGDSAEDPLEFIASATDVICRVTVDNDFTTVAAGKLMVEVFYLSTKYEYNNPGYPLEINA